MTSSCTTGLKLENGDLTEKLKMTTAEGDVCLIVRRETRTQTRVWMFFVFPVKSLWMWDYTRAHELQVCVSVLKLIDVQMFFTKGQTKTNLLE